MKTLVSILIPVYNRVSIVGKSIEASLNQTYPNIEIIIFDNCSTDGTWELLQKYAEEDRRIRIFKNNENIGPVRNWKRCIQEAEGEYAKILFSDDLIDPNFVEETMAVFDDNTAFVLSGMEIRTSDSNNLISISNFQNIKEMDMESFIKECCFENKIGFPVSPGAGIFRKSDLLKNLLFDIPNSDNLDHSKNGAGIDQLLFLLTATNYKVVKCVDKILCTFYAHSGSITIAAEGKLNIYYDWAMYYFLNKYRKHYLPFFKTIIILKRLKHGKIYSGLLSELQDPKINFKFLIKRVIRKYINESTK